MGLERLRACDHAKHIDGVLTSFYGRTIADILFVTGIRFVLIQFRFFIYLLADNAEVNIKLARDELQCPMVNCFAHRFNLWMKAVNKKYEDLIAAVHGLCLLLRDMIPANILENIQETNDLPVLRSKSLNVTRWSSTFEMFERFIRNKAAVRLMRLETVVKKYEAVGVEERKHHITVEEFFETLKPFQSIIKALQRRSLKIDEAQELFNKVVYIQMYFDFSLLLFKSCED
jgi:hypothetical protein